MQAISDALSQLNDDVSWFLRATEIKLLAIQTSAELRPTVVRLLSMFEFHRDNKAPWTLFEDAHTRKDSGWHGRTTHLLTEWGRRRDAVREAEGIELPVATVQVPTVRQALSSVDPDLQRFNAAVQACTTAARGTLIEAKAGFVLVFAPALLETPDAFGEDLQKLMVDERNTAMRFVFVDDASRSLPALVQRLGKRALVCRCVADPEQQKKDFAAVVAAPQIGRAGPRGVKPPARIGDPPADKEKQAEAWREAGIDPAYLEKSPALARHVLTAALAFSEGRGADAVREQRAACELSLELRLHDVHVITRIALGSYLSGLGMRDRAIAEVTAAMETAQKHELGLPEVQARLALGLLYALDKRYTESAREYAECARRAEQLLLPTLAIEGWRLAAQIAVQSGAEAQAVACFNQAIRVAQGSETDLVQASSASECARMLGKLCAGRELEAQAVALFEQADAMEAGKVGKVKAESSSEGAVPRAR